MIITRLSHIVIIVLLATFQVAVALWMGGHTPQFILAGVMALALAGDAENTLWWIALGGLLLDVMSGGTVGSSVVAFSVIGALLVLLNRQLLDKPSLPVAFTVFFATALLYIALTDLLTGQLSWTILSSSIGTGLLTVAAYRLVTYLGSRREVIRLG